MMRPVMCGDAKLNQKTNLASSRTLLETPRRSTEHCFTYFRYDNTLTVHRFRSRLDSLQKKNVNAEYSFASSKTEILLAQFYKGVP